MATRDYAKRPPSRSGSRGRCWLWLVAGVGVGMVAQLILQSGVGVGDVNSMMSAVLPARQQQAAKPPVPRKTPAKPAPPKPHFDFYNILPEMEVVVPDSEVEARKPVAPKPAKPDAQSQAKGTRPAPRPAPTAGDPGGTFVLQVGSFRNYAEADQRKAALALLGFEARIQKVTVNGQDWHRVRIGPFKDLTRVNSVRSRLRDRRIQAIVLKLSS